MPPTEYRAAAEVSKDILIDDGGEPSRTEAGGEALKEAPLSMQRLDDVSRD